jgi:hypothetical protein
LGVPVGTGPLDVAEQFAVAGLGVATDGVRVAALEGSVVGLDPPIASCWSGLTASLGGLPITGLGGATAMVGGEGAAAGIAVMGAGSARSDVLGGALEGAGTEPAE